VGGLLSGVSGGSVIGTRYGTALNVAVMRGQRRTKKRSTKVSLLAGRGEKHFWAVIRDTIEGCFSHVFVAKKEVLVVG